MVEVRLHGELAAQFGRVWNLDIETPAEAVRAIECGKPGFVRKILELDKRGMVFRVRSKDHDYNNDDVGMRLGSVKRIDIIPLVCGAQAGLRFVAGLVLVIVGGVVTAYSGGSASPAGAALYSAGVSLMLGAIVEWLTPVPKRSDFENQRARSWTLDGAGSTVDQGSAVPVIYGEVLTSGLTISAGLAAVQVNVSGSLTPAVTVLGRLEHNAQLWGGAGLFTFNIPLSAGIFNLSEPYTFTWSITTPFASPVSAQIVDAGKATCKLVLVYSLSAAPSSIADQGVVQIAMTGIETSTSSGSAPQTVNVNASATIKIVVDAVELPSGG